MGNPRRGRVNRRRPRAKTHQAITRGTRSVIARFRSPIKSRASCHQALLHQPFTIHLQVIIVSPVPRDTDQEFPRTRHGCASTCSRSRAPHRGGRGRGRGEHARALLVPRQRRRLLSRGHGRAPPRPAPAPRLRRCGQLRLHAHLGRDGQRGAPCQRCLGGCRRQGQTHLRRPPARCEGGDAGGERGPARRHLRRRGQARRRHARHGQPRLRLHPEGVPGKRQQPLRAELQVPRPHRQEAQGAITLIIIINFRSACFGSHVCFPCKELEDATIFSLNLIRSRLLLLSLGDASDSYVFRSQEGTTICLTQTSMQINQYTTLNHTFV